MKNTTEKIISFSLASVLVPFLALAAMSSPNYKVPSDVFGDGGGWGTSENFGVYDTIGEDIIGPGSSANYGVNAGFWQADMFATISLDCGHTVAMGAIAGSGQSSLMTNSSTCTVITDNGTGYSLSWKASSAEMLSASDSFPAYTPGTPNTPENWSVANTDAEWGGHLGATSTTVNTGTWGSADTYGGGKWLNIGTSDFGIATRSTPTSLAGDDEVIWFGAEVGSSKIQPTGNYTVTVTMTAVTL